MLVVQQRLSFRLLQMLTAKPCIVLATDSRSAACEIILDLVGIWEHQGEAFLFDDRDTLMGTSGEIFKAQNLIAESFAQQLRIKRD